MRRMTRISVACAAVCAAVAMSVLYARRTESAPGPRASTNALPVDARPVSHQPSYEIQESHAGRVVSRRSSALGFERGGRLDSVAADEGERVTAGQVLAALDTRQLRAQRRQMAAQATEIEAELAMARLTTQRRRALRASDHIAPEQLDQARYREQGLEARLAAARAGLEAVDASLALSEIRAPYAGIITARHADEGTVLSPSQPILQLIEDGALEVHVGLPPEAASALEPGARVTIEIEGQPQEASLHAVVDAVERETRTVTAIFRLEPGVGSARDGALARVSLPRRIESAGFWLPLSALAESHRGLWSAYVVVPDAERGDAPIFRVDRRQLEVLHAEADRAFVRGTLQDGERVVWSGVHRLVADQRVRLDDGR